MGAMVTSKRGLEDLRLMIKPFMPFQMSQWPLGLTTPSQTWVPFTPVSHSGIVKMENVLERY